MSTATERFALPGTESNIRICLHCGNRYDWRRSPSSSLKMTYCGTLCERAALGFTIEALLEYQPQSPAKSASTDQLNMDGPAMSDDIGSDAEALVGLIAA